MTVQQAYELMRVYLTRPGARQAKGPDGGCMYQTVIEGALHRCAVGCLLTEQELSQTIEVTPDLVNDTGDTFLKRSLGRHVALSDFQGSLGDVLDTGYGLRVLDIDDPVEGERMFEFLSGAQGIHDTSDNWVNGEFNVAKLDRLAYSMGLKVVREEGSVQEETQMQEPVAVAASVV